MSLHLGWAEAVKKKHQRKLVQTYVFRPVGNFLHFLKTGNTTIIILKDKIKKSLNVSALPL